MKKLIQYGSVQRMPGESRYRNCRKQTTNLIRLCSKIAECEITKNNIIKQKERQKNVNTKNKDVNELVTREE